MNKAKKGDHNTHKYKPIYVFLFSVLPFFWFLYDLGPNIIFYFDQIEGSAIVKNITKKGEIEFSYVHKSSTDKIELISSAYPKKNLTEIDKKRTVDILYSNHFPEMVVLKDIDNKPDFILSLFLILIWTLPLFFYKDIKLE